MDNNDRSNLNQRISVDCVIFGFDFEKLNVLLIKRKSPENGRLNQFSLPGDLIFETENLEQAAIRVLHDLTGLKDIFLEQLGAFSVDRHSNEEDRIWLRAVREQPEAHVITVAYYALVNLTSFELKPAYFASSASWQPIDEINSLAFGHMNILNNAHKQLRTKLKIQPIGFNLLPEKFTLSQLHKLYEVIVGKALDKRNFRRKLIKLQIVKKLDEKQVDVPHKPSNFYAFNTENYRKLVEDGFDNFGF
ncbi:NUDIX hydrolase [Crocinitomix catalasitica]|uniref:NUDIX hydrolase n=1 Tax=Crocinitomix catalasitica TaxID=184607 RepID=UPI0004896FAF|nr:NUDIX domain-containing protein [Crocinitomix catalasitica]